MKTPAALEALAALANEYRLGVFRLLVERGPLGLPAGEIAERMNLVPSSLTFHLQHLHRAGLVTQNRVSRQLFYAVDFTVMDGLIAFLTENCCAASDAACAADCVPAKRASSRRKPTRSLKARVA